MKTNRILAVLLSVILISLFFTSCKKDDPNDPTPTPNQFVSLENPYLICANRNPGGVGFDFEYKANKGGGNNMDSLTVNDFEYDIIIRTIKAEKPDQSLGGAPYIKLHDDVMAVNYSEVDTSCKGYGDFQNLTAANIQAYTLQADDVNFDINSVPTGSTGQPLMNDLLQEYNKLVIGQKWKEAANNTIIDDEPIWIIQTREGKIVKFIVTQFPANPAPTSTGYIVIVWDFVE